MRKGAVKPGSEWFKQTYFESIAFAWLVSDFLEQNGTKITISCFFLAWKKSLSGEQKKQITALKEVVGTLDEFVNEDPQHESMPRTGMSKKQQLSPEFLP